MKWGVRKQRSSSSGSSTTRKKSNLLSNVKAYRLKTKRRKQLKKNVKAGKQNAAKKKSVKNMSDAELQKAISRLEMEKKYNDLAQSQMSIGKKAVTEITLRAAKNIGEQAMVYAMGTAVNKAFQKQFGEDIVNPKKGQRDKK